MDYNCKCGSTVNVYKRTRHEKSLKHIRLIKEIEENEALLNKMYSDK